jgi:hypothetical protein
MSFLMVTTIWGVTALAAAAIAGVLAGIKNRDYSFWMGWSFILPPMVIALAFLPRLRGARPRQPSFDELDRSPD